MNALAVPSYTDAMSYSHADRRPHHKAEDAYRTISEVADELNVAQHVLRFWESKFKQIEPLKRAGGRRYYRREDVDLLKRIHFMLYSQGYTIKGVQKLLVKDRHLVQAVPAMTPANNPLPDTLPPALRQPVANNTAVQAPSYVAPPVMAAPVAESAEDTDTDQLNLFNASDRMVMMDVLRRLKAAQALLNG
jgi:DNA-binding transcriptional MerR regulator